MCFEAAARPEGRVSAGAKHVEQHPGNSDQSNRERGELSADQHPPETPHVGGRGGEGCAHDLGCHEL